jgi:hypothetical protein
MRKLLTSATLALCLIGIVGGPAKADRTTIMGQAYRTCQNAMLSRPDISTGAVLLFGATTDTLCSCTGQIFASGLSEADVNQLSAHWSLSPAGIKRLNAATGLCLLSLDR